MPTLPDDTPVTTAPGLAVLPTPPLATPGSTAPAGYLADAFDLLNVRDLDLIAQARSQCGRLTLGVYTDEHAEHVTGRRPVVPLGERLALLEHVRGVDAVVVHQESGSAPAATRVFVAAGQLVPGAGDVTVLTPRRETRGPVLREALSRRGEREAVA